MKSIFKPISRRSGAFVSKVTLIALSALGAYSPRVARAEIIDGVVDSRNQFSAVVNLFFDAQSGSERSRSWCSGTFISSDTILTAAHCFCGEGRASVVLGGEAYPLRVASHPHYNCAVEDELQLHDLALARLKGDAPGVTPISIQASLSVSGGTPAVMVGFGKSQLVAEADGKRRYGVTTLLEDTGDLRDQVEKDLGDSAAAYYLNTPVRVKLNSRGNKVKRASGPAAWVGDSGGPLLVFRRVGENQTQLVPEIIGVAQILMMTRDPESREITHFVNVYTRLDQHGNGDWVLNELANWPRK